LAVGLFAFVHILYTTTFGFKPLRMLLGILVYTLMVGVASYVLPKIGQMELKMVFPIYMFLIHTMLWRALAKLNLKNIRYVQIMIALGKLIIRNIDSKYLKK
jgi:hypothetical protein